MIRTQIYIKSLFVFFIIYTLSISALGLLLPT